jgi:hypothetical protein
MRTQISARAVPSHSSDLVEDRVSLTIRPPVRCRELILRHKQGFVAAHADLPAVELSEKTRAQIGYFID